MHLKHIKIINKLGVYEYPEKIKWNLKDCFRQKNSVWHI